MSRKVDGAENTPANLSRNVADIFDRAGLKPKPKRCPFEAKIERLPPDKRKLAYSILRDNPDNPEYHLWKVFPLKPSGEGQHQNLVKNIADAIFRFDLVPHDPESDVFQDYIENIAQEYALSHGTIDNARKQVQYALEKAGGDKGDVKVDPDKPVFKKKDTRMLSQIPRIPTSKITGTFQQPEDINLAEVTPREYLETIFGGSNRKYGSKLSSEGYIATGESSYVIATLSELNDFKDGVVDYSKHAMYSQSVFKEKFQTAGNRTLENFAKRVVIVFECDQDTVEERERSIGFAFRLRQYAPLVAVIDSGGKSVHFVFMVHDVDPKHLKRFMELAVLYGADRAPLVNKTGWVRMPNVQSGEDGRRLQKLLYFDPKQAGTTSATNWDIVGLEDSLQHLNRIAFYYHDGTYYYKNASNGYIVMSQGNASLMLAEQGVRNIKLEGEAVSPADKYLIDRAENFSVHEVLKCLAGHDAGVLSVPSGKNILIRETRKFAELREVAGKWDSIKQFLEELFVEGEDRTEYDVFLGWLAEGVRNLYNNGEPRSNITPSLYMAIVGDANAGKSFLLNRILTPLFGGRSAKADPLFAQKDTVFNAAQSGSELLYLDDTAKLNSDDRSRIHQGEIIKTICVASENDEAHAKGVDALGVPKFHRIIRMLNHSKMDTLPLINEKGVGDKICLLHGRKPEHAERSQRWGDALDKKIDRELPDFFTYLIKDHIVPEYVRPDEQNARFPVIAYKNARLVEDMLSDSKCGFLGQLVDRGLLEYQGKAVYEGTTDDIMRYLLDNLNGSDRDRFKSMFSHPKKIEVALKDLRSLSQDRGKYMYSHDSFDSLQPEKKRGSYYWVIELPESQIKDEERPKKSDVEALADLFKR